MALSKADRAWVRKQLAKQREDLKRDLQDILAEEARLAFLQNMTMKPQVLE